ncbi:putative VCBS repeat-containing protein [Candidatus Magnetomoraceae bacterium gMMP-15]
MNKIKSIIISLIFCLIYTNLYAEQITKVAILPFNVNAEGNIRILQNMIRDMISTRIYIPEKVEIFDHALIEDTLVDTTILTSKDALKFGKVLGVDHILFGSISKFGNSFSIDARMLDISGSKKPFTFYSQTQIKDDVIPIINEMASRISSEFFESQHMTIKIKEQKPQAAKKKTIYMHPERLLEQEDSEESEESERYPAVASTKRPALIKTDSKLDFIRMQNLKHEIKGMSFADLDSDGILEIILIDSQNVYVYKPDQKRLRLLGKYEGKSSDKFLTVDAADMDNSGKPEIYITCFNTLNERLKSFLLKWDGNSLKSFKDHENWYFRIVDIPSRGSVLLGQRQGMNSFFSPGVYELKWNGPDLTEAQRIDVPSTFNFASLNFGRITGDEPGWIGIPENNKLIVLNESGGKEWESEDALGESINSLVLKPKGHNEYREKHIYLNQRILIADLNNNNKDEIIVVKQNTFTGGRILGRHRSYKSGTITAFEWDGLGMETTWTTKKITGYISDYSIVDFNGDGRKELVIALVLTQGLMKKTKSTIIYYSL